jgi:hypothetical protein
MGEAASMLAARIETIFNEEIFIFGLGFLVGETSTPLNRGAARQCKPLNAPLHP